jgi:hypothetical protein
MLELSFLIICVVIVLILLYRRTDASEDAEHFDTMYSLSSCPAGYKSSYNSNGNIMCCNGDMVASKCIGSHQCSLNGNGSDGVPNCVDFILKDYETKGRSQCPVSLPNYYENMADNTKGCTSGLRNNVLTGPRDFNQPKCKIYETMDENVNGVDSCYNQRHIDEYPCFGNNCTKAAIQPIKNGPVLITVSFTDSMGMHRTTYTRQSVETFLDSVKPNWRNQGFDTSKNVAVAEVAKAFYVDRTIAQGDVQI